MALEAVLAGLARAGLDEAEAYVKRGRSRRLERGPAGDAAVFRQEQGWAIRASGPRASLAAAGSGEPPVGDPWPQPDGAPFRLPDPVPAAPWTAPSDFETPLIGESEGLRLLSSLERELAAELPGARLLHAVLEDGSSEHRLLSSRGAAGRWRSRLASLRLEAAAPAGGGRPATAALYLAERDARRFNTPALARRLADRLAVTAGGTAGERDRAEVLLAPAVAVRLLAGLLPLLVGPDAGSRIAALRDRRGRVGSDALTVIDDGRLPGGALEAPCDGEGLATREVVLLEQGTFRQPLLAWHQVHGSEGRASGCSRRASWRDLPAPGPTHLYIRPQRSVGVAALLAEVARGYYLLDATGPGRFDLDEGRFRLPVCGFAVQGGRAVTPIAGAALSGGLAGLLRGVQAVARDLTFLPLDGMIGSPTLLVGGLELSPL